MAAIRPSRARSSAICGLVLLAALVGLALGAEHLAPVGPFVLSRDVLEPPSPAHPFGTDELGRDLFAGVVHGTRVSLATGLGSALLATLLGTLAGSAAVLERRALDEIVMRLAELFQVIPRFFLVLVAMVVFGRQLWLIVVLLGLTYWPITARVLRGQILSIRSREYVAAARAIGGSGARVLIRHILPAALPPVIIQTGFHAGGAILVEAGLSFLGLGDPDRPSWGALLSRAQEFAHLAWWLPVFPGVAITLAVLGFTLVADGLSAGGGAVPSAHPADRRGGRAGERRAFPGADHPSLPAR